MKQSTNIKNLKVALVTDWMTSFGGETRVLKCFHELFPDAPIYTTVFNKKELPEFAHADIRESFIGKKPFSLISKKKHQWFIGAMPYAFEAMDLSEYDLVLSSSHAASKGVITDVHTLHVCYCHAPMRYAWEGCHRYIRENSPLKWLGGEFFARKLTHKLRMWDRLAADRVDTFIGNSHFIRKQIDKYYERDARVIYPPIETSRFRVAEKKKSYLLAGGRLIPNKKIDLVVQAATEEHIPLKVFGKGPDLERLKAMAGPTVEFVGFVPEEEVATLFAEAAAFVVPQVEDFGIVTVEALASGTPVIGLNKGGTAEIVTDGVTGVLMEEQTVKALRRAIKRFRTMNFSSSSIRQQALQYDVARFKRDMLKFLQETYTSYSEFLTQ